MNRRWRVHQRTDAVVVGRAYLLGVSKVTEDIRILKKELFFAIKVTPLGVILVERQQAVSCMSYGRMRPNIVRGVP